MTSLLKLAIKGSKENSNFTGVFVLLGMSAICLIGGGIALILTLWLHSSWLGPVGVVLILASFAIDKIAERWSKRKLKASQLDLERAEAELKDAQLGLECAEVEHRAAQVDLGYAEAIRQEWS